MWPTEQGSLLRGRDGGAAGFSQGPCGAAFRENTHTEWREGGQTPLLCSVSSASINDNASLAGLSASFTFLLSEGWFWFTERLLDNFLHITIQPTHRLDTALAL